MKIIITESQFALLTENDENKPRLKKNTLYWIGRPKVSKEGDGKIVTTYDTFIMDDNADGKYDTKSYTSLGKLDVPSEVVNVTKAEFKTLLKNFNDFQLTY